MAKPGSKFDFRDVSVGLQKLRSILLGREHRLHGRFPPLISPRTIPQPDIPRGPEYKYSKQYYFERNPAGSVKPPVVAPIAEGPPLNQNPTMKAQPGGVSPDSVCFANAPTPGLPWWWDGHCYYEVIPEPCPPCPPPSCQPIPPPNADNKCQN